MREMIQKRMLFILLIFVTLGVLPTKAALSPIGISIMPPLQFPSTETSVTGLRLGALWARHRNVYGLDLGGLGTVTEQHFGGLLQAAGVFNYNGGGVNIVGLQLAGLFTRNVNKTKIAGAQIAGVVNSNVAESRVVGLQIASLANLADHTTIVGLQVGLVNKARKVYGFQIGLINIADEVRGLQIGLMNIHRQGLFYACPVINFGF